jgi:hypothetical protein
MNRRVVLVLGVSVPIVDCISEGSVSFGHFGVATQYMVLWTACIGPAGPGCIELPSGWLVLICEEGLVPPINTNSSDKRVGQIVGNKRETGWGGIENVVAYFAIPGEVDLESFGVVLEAKRSHGKENILAVDRLALLLLALLGGWVLVSG